MDTRKIPTDPINVLSGIGLLLTPFKNLNHLSFEDYQELAEQRSQKDDISSSEAIEIISRERRIGMTWGFLFTIACWACLISYISLSDSNPNNGETITDILVSLFAIIPTAIIIGSHVIATPRIRKRLELNTLNRNRIENH